MRKVLIYGVSILLMSCTPEALEQNKKSDKHFLKVEIVGQGAELFINGARSTVGEILQVKTNDVITGSSQSYHEDNSNNYGAPDVTVTSKITMYVDGVLEREGSNNLTIIIK